MFLRLCISFVFLVTFSGCLKFAEKKADNAAQTDIPFPELQGQWLGDCQTDRIDLFGFKSKKSKYTYEGKQNIREGYWYLDEDCKSVGQIQRAVFTFVVGEEVSRETDIRKIDYKHISSTLENKEAGIVEVANKAKLFGYSNWTIDTPLDVTGRKINENTEASMSGNLIYDLFKIDGNKLFEGDGTTGDRNSEAMRPKLLNNIYLKRQ